MQEGRPPSKVAGDIPSSNERVNMAQIAFLYFRQSGDTLKRRVLVHGEPQVVAELNEAAGLHLSPKTCEGQEVEAALRAQRGWLMAQMGGIDGVRLVEPVTPSSDDIDFDVHRADTGDWAKIMQGISDAIGLVLGQSATITMLDGPI